MRFRKPHDPDRPVPVTTRGMIDEVADDTSGAELTLGGLLDRFNERAYGVFLLFSLIPAIVPGGGAIGGPLICLIGLQLMVQMEHPWVPKFIARRPLSREGMQTFRKHTSRLLRWIEKVSRPRTEVLIEHPAAHVFTGVLLVLLGALLALPLPATNYIFGAILLAYAIALIERDGRLMAVAWVAGLIEIGAIGMMSGQIAAWVAKLFS
jgi:hypothetical protein